MTLTEKNEILSALAGLMTTVAKIATTDTTAPASESQTPPMRLHEEARHGDYIIQRWHSGGSSYPIHVVWAANLAEVPGTTKDALRKIAREIGHEGDDGNTQSFGAKLIEAINDAPFSDALATLRLNSRSDADYLAALERSVVEQGGTVDNDPNDITTGGRIGRSIMWHKNKGKLPMQFPIKAGTYSDDKTVRVGKRQRGDNLIPTTRYTDEGPIPEDYVGVWDTLVTKGIATLDSGFQRGDRRRAVYVQKIINMGRLMLVNKETSKCIAVFGCEVLNAPNGAAGDVTLKLTERLYEAR